MPKYCYEYPKADLTVDIILIYNNKLLLIKRKNEPFQNHWAFPGGFIELNETLVESAYRELKEETNIDNIKLKQFKTYGNPNRDPRGRTVSIVFYSFIDKLPKNFKPQDDAIDINFFDLKNLPKLAFDHKKIIDEFIQFYLKN